MRWFAVMSSTLHTQDVCALLCTLTTSMQLIIIINLCCTSTNSTRLSSTLDHFSCKRLLSRLDHFNCTILSTTLGHFNTTRLSTTLGHFNYTRLLMTLGHFNTTRLSSTLDHFNYTRLFSTLVHFNCTRLSTTLGHFNTTRLSSTLVQFNCTRLLTILVHFNSTILSTTLGHFNTTRLSSTLVHFNCTRLLTTLSTTTSSRVTSPLHQTIPPVPQATSHLQDDVADAQGALILNASIPRQLIQTAVPFQALRSSNTPLLSAPTTSTELALAWWAFLVVALHTGSHYLLTLDLVILYKVVPTLRSRKAKEQNRTYCTHL